MNNIPTLSQNGSQKFLKLLRISSGITSSRTQLWTESRTRIMMLASMLNSLKHNTYWRISKNSIQMTSWWRLNLNHILGLMLSLMNKSSMKSLKKLPIKSLIKVVIIDYYLWSEYKILYNSIITHNTVNFINFQLQLKRQVF